jgi:hypothetical protein
MRRQFAARSAPRCVRQRWSGAHTNIHSAPTTARDSHRCDQPGCGQSQLHRQLQRTCQPHSRVSAMSLPPQPPTVPSRSGAATTPGYKAVARSTYDARSGMQRLGVYVPTIWARVDGYAHVPSLGSRAHMRLAGDCRAHTRDTMSCARISAVQDLASARAGRQSSSLYTRPPGQ